MLLRTFFTGWQAGSCYCHIMCSNSHYEVSLIFFLLLKGI